ncbi:membrane protein insertase YidC [Clostridium mediterraneense]|uniref:membrane protein insertase YidC n=1 Tax=Clostridium mediterraneense TaxID=1805472 RepID=UPI000A8CA18A|nr:membrane protein insertase YidC [Clostridium mediterraneense]
MYKILAPITNIFLQIFNAFLNFVSSLGHFSPGTNYVIAVVLLTLLVRLIILPLTIKQMRSSAKMQEVQPLVKKAQEKYKGNPEKANMEVMKIYKENNVSMSGGCLPLLIQMPILFALYDVFRNINTGGASFLWLSNLGQPDPYYILPVISGLTTYFSSYLMQKGSGSSQASPINMGTMNIVMAVMLGFMSMKFPSLLVIYWITGNLIQMVQTYFLIILPKQRKERNSGVNKETDFIDVKDVKEVKNKKNKKKK